VVAAFYNYNTIHKLSEKDAAWEKVQIRLGDFLRENSSREKRPREPSPLGAFSLRLASLGDFSQGRF